MRAIEGGEEEKEVVYSWLRDYNHERNGDFMRSLEVEGTEVPLFLTKLEEPEGVIGGLEGLMLHQWLRIHIMAVHPRYRGKGDKCFLTKRL
ncbi:MAG: hypothetical protein AAF191_12300 [Verrucomicrobiota bacterium]